MENHITSRRLANKTQEEKSLGSMFPSGYVCCSSSKMSFGVGKKKCIHPELDMWQ